MHFESTAIKEASLSDTGILAFLIRNSHWDVAKTFGLTPENCPAHPSNCTPDWIEKDLKQGISYFIQVDSGIAAGCVAMEKVDGDFYCVKRLSVLPARRGRGFGKNLISRVIDEVRRLGGTRISAAIIARNASLKQWYETLGFREGETRRFEHLPFEVTYLILAVDENP
jgi:GNAT superfamily N-acetyltransferase